MRNTQWVCPHTHPHAPPPPGSSVNHCCNRVINAKWTQPVHFSNPRRPAAFFPHKALGRPSPDLLPPGFCFLQTSQPRVFGHRRPTLDQPDQLAQAQARKAQRPTTKHRCLLILMHLRKKKKKALPTVHILRKSDLII